MVDKQLMSILVCPITQTPLKWDKSTNELISVAAGLAYPIRNGIPVMLENEARSMELEETERWRAAQNT